MKPEHKHWWIVALLIVAWLLWMTLRPNPDVAANLEVLTAPAAEQGLSAFWLIDIAGNIVVFAPLGAAVTLAVAGKRSLTSWILGGTAAGLAVSVTIELLQGLTHTRVSSPGDVALNTLGAGLGALVAAWGASRRRHARDS